jgi:methanogen homocitrate synthase
LEDNKVQREVIMLFNIDEKELAQEIIFDPEGKWWNCYSNLLNVVTKDFSLPERVIVKDETLREGLVVPGRKQVDTAALLEVAAALAEAGFTQLEVGFTAAVDEHREFAKMLKREGVKMAHSAHTRTWAKDWKAEIDGVIEAGADIVNLIGFGTVETEKFVLPGMRKEELAELYGKQVEYSKKQGKFTSFMISTNVTRPDIIYDCYKSASDAGVNRVYVADSYGCSTPEGTKYLITWIRDIVGPGIEIGLHQHNDFGLATANALAAVTAGASVIDTSINGLGDRGGVPSADAVVASLEVLYGVKTGIKLDKLRPLSDLIQKYWGIPIEPHRAVIGDNVYRHETDIHIAALLSGLWYAYNVIKPEVLGMKESLEFGLAALAKGESSAVGVKINTMGLRANDEQFDRILDLIREEIKKSPRGFATEEKVAEIIQRVLK